MQVHGDPTRAELETGGVAEALVSLKQRGLIRFSGLSSRLPKLAEFVDADWLDVIQVPWSALQRTNEDVISALKRAGKADGEGDVLAKIAEMKGSDRAMAKRIQDIIKISAPARSPKTPRIVSTWHSGQVACRSVAIRQSASGSAEADALQRSQWRSSPGSGRLRRFATA